MTLPIIVYSAFFGRSIPYSSILNVSALGKCTATVELVASIIPLLRRAENQFAATQRTDEFLLHLGLLVFLLDGLNVSQLYGLINVRQFLQFDLQFFNLFRRNSIRLPFPNLTNSRIVPS